MASLCETGTIATLSTRASEKNSYYHLIVRLLLVYEAVQTKEHHGETLLPS
jgi:hypothetical protein